MPWKVLHFPLSHQLENCPSATPPQSWNLFWSLQKSHVFFWWSHWSILLPGPWSYFLKEGWSLIFQSQRCGCWLLSSQKWNSHRLRPCLCTPQNHTHGSTWGPPIQLLFLPTHYRLLHKQFLCSSSLILSLFSEWLESETLDYERFNTHLHVPGSNLRELTVYWR